MTDSPEIRAQAAKWLAWVDSGHDCPVKQRQFEDWLRADGRHQEIDSRLEQSWRRPDQLSQLATGETRMFRAARELRS